MPDGLLIAKNDHAECRLLPQMANRHGLVTGATGTGKTVSLQTLAEHFSAIGVPVFMADVKGDLAGLAQAGGGNAKVAERVQALGLEDFHHEAFPVMLWDAYGKAGHPLRATVSDLGPLLLGRMLGLNDTQTGVPNLVFKVADDQGLLLLDLKDLRALLQYAGEHARDFITEYGNISAASVGAIQRALLELESQGGAQLFGEPMLDIADFMQTDRQGRGYINILAADQLMQAPKLYATLLLWLLSELFEKLPEVGDPAQPRLVFFFDEAHLLFSDAPDALLDKIEQVVRLIRSKGVGVYFATQNPADLPDKVLSQLGNRIQHALRAFSPRDQKAVRTAAETLRDNPQLDEQTAIAELAVGEALVSFLDAKGRPAVTQRAWVLPPHSRLGPLSGEERRAVLAASLVAGHYEQAVDRESAYEILKARTATQTAATQPPAGKSGGLGDILTGAGRRQGVLEAAVKSMARSIGSQLGRQILRGVLGGILGGKR